MHILLVKLSSMGDLIHALPALTDAVKNNPGVTFDWVIDESFSEVALWHPSVKRVIKSAHRRWRKNILKSFYSGEISRFIKELRQTRYDLVIDGQNNMKSGFVTFFTKGVRWGLDKATARESMASLAYQHHVHIPKNQHAITRMRQLFSKILNYSEPTSPPDFGIDTSIHHAPKNLNLPKKYLFFIHNASWKSKLWPEEYWLELLRYATGEGYSILIPSGNEVELKRSQRLSSGFNCVYALPKLSLSEVAFLINHAQGAVSVDTGLSHLTAALDTPSVTIYGSTDPGLIGAMGEENKQINLHANFPCAPCYKGSCFYKGKAEQSPACYTKIPPIKVWKTLKKLL